MVAKELLDSVLEAAELSQLDLIAEFKGRDLEGIVCQHPLFQRDSLVILGDHVTLDAGTGCVHTAPGHGLEDYVVGLRYDLPAFSPVDAQGRFTEEAGVYAGLTLDEGNKVVTQDLEKAGALLKLDFVSHSYPHCWRCKEPVIYRSTEQWFVSIDQFRQEMLDAINKVEWIPAWGIDRITGMVRDRGDWCISRQRVWGVPIPVLYCECGETVISGDTISHIAEIFRKEGSNAWYSKDASELVPDGYKCPKCGGRHFQKETDTMDVWFDSGVSHAAVLQQRPELGWPADLYLEGSDQHRGWFQSSLSTSIAAFGKAPYKAVLTHGFVVDGDGKKMSKSLGNVVGPEEVCRQYGADVLRMWVASAEYRGDIRISGEIMKQLSEAYRRIRNTARFLLGNIYDFDPAQDSVPYEEMEELDQWALMKLAKLSERVRDAYRNYDFHLVYHSVHHFCAVDLGGFYLDVLKDRLYCDAQTSRPRRSAQTAFCVILKELVHLIAPIMVFTADEIWQNLPEQLRNEESVHLSRWQDLPPEYMNQDLEERWNDFLEIRRVVAKALEIARTNKLIGASNEATITILGSDEIRSTLKRFADDIRLLLIASNVTVRPLTEAVDVLYGEEDLGIAVHVEKADGEKCERCWKYSSTVGEDPTHPQICKRCLGVVTQ